MSRSSKIKIVEQELSLEEAKKIVGGSGGRDKNEDKPKPNPCPGGLGSKLSLFEV